ncbi:DUF4304 domain-containing protein [Dactylosporangium sp. NPDC006015]|uniref:DUF4304 domain-containing protein n=1 Tax=Dactylosporangium sp. NPDC006015 TaxID=3154576 RepID=UPI0033B2CE82
MSRPAVDRTAKAVISELLARDVVPVLKRHGFAGRGRNFRRTREGRQELVTVEPHRWNDRHGGAFAIDLGVFIDALDAAESPVPPAEPPARHECHLHVGSGFRWTFDAVTDLRALGASAGEWVLREALPRFDRLATGAGVLDWLRDRTDPPGLRQVYLAATAGAPELAQAWLDRVVAEAAPWPLPVRREAARFAALLGLRCPPPVDSPTLTVTLRLPHDVPPARQEEALRQLSYKLHQHLTELRAGRPAAQAATLYHALRRDGLVCTADFYGAPAEDLLRPLRRAFAKLAPQFADIRESSTPGGGSPAPPPPPD